MLVSVASKTRLTPNGGGGGHESSLLLQFILYIVFIAYNMKDDKAIERTQLSLSIGPTVQ